MARFSVMIMNRTIWTEGRDGIWYEEVEDITEAPTEAEALKIFEAKYDTKIYKVQTHTLQNIGEYANRYAKRNEQWRKEKEEVEKKKAEEKARKEAREKAKAEALGMTVEAYRKMKKNEATARRIRKEIEELKQELARKEAYLAKLEA